jgi:HTH-type transcriptional regulator/antitoxin HigA
MIHPVVDKESHERALRRVEALWDASPGSPQERELDALATLIDAYERRAFPITPPDPIDAILVRCEQLGWTRKDLEPMLGSRARVSEVLTRARALTLPMIRRLHLGMGVPAEVLIAEPSRPPGARSSQPAPSQRAARSTRRRAAPVAKSAAPARARG